jgi:hypothetical protein
MRGAIRERLLRRDTAKKRRPRLRTPAYAGRHEGATALVLGNGPSLRTHGDALRRLIAAERAITLGANNITAFTHPDYHAFTNRKRFARYGHSIDPERSRVLLSPYFSRALIERHYRGPYEEISYVADNDARFDVSEGVIQASGRTVSVLLIGVAAVMGAERILVAGLDGFAGVLAGERPDPASVYHAETELLKERAPEYEEIDRYTRRFLAEIQGYLERHGRAPFAIVTPTAYEEHHRHEPLAVHQ